MDYRRKPKDKTKKLPLIWGLCSLPVYLLAIIVFDSESKFLAQFLGMISGFPTWIIIFFFARSGLSLGGPCAGPEVFFFYIPVMTAAFANPFLAGFIHKRGIEKGWGNARAFRIALAAFLGSGILANLLYQFVSIK